MWSVMAAVCSKGLAFLAAAVIARWLGKEGFGRLGMIQSTVDVFTVFAGFGLGLASTRAAAYYRESDPQRVGRVIGISGLVAGVTGALAGLTLCFAAPQMARRLLADPEMATPLRISAIAMFFAAMNSAQMGALAGFMAFKAIAKASVIGGLCNFFFLVGGVYFGGLTGVVWGIVLGWLVTWSIFRFVLIAELRSQGIHLTLRGARKEIGSLWHFSIPSVLSDGVSLPATWISRSMLASQPQGYGELGIFNVAYQLTLLLGQAAAVLGAPLLPMLAKDSGNLGSPQMKKVNILFFWGLGTILVFPFLAFPESLAWFFGPRYIGDDTRKVFVLALLFTWITTYKRGLANALVTNGRMWWSFLSNLFWGLALLGTLALFPVKNALALAASLLIAYGANVAIFIPIYMKTGFIPKGSIFSWPAALIWGAFFFVGFSSFYGLIPWFRVGGTLMCGFAIAMAFIRLWRAPLSPSNPSIDDQPGGGFAR